MTTQTGGVGSGNSTSVNDWHATKAAFHNALTGHGVTRGTLQNAENVMNLLNGVDITHSTQASVVNTQASQAQSLTSLAVGADGTTGINPLDHGQGHADFSTVAHHFGHLWG